MTLMCLQGEYYEASCQAINPAAKELTAAFPSHGNGSTPKTFKIKYDLLVVGVSAAAAAVAFECLWGCSSSSSLLKTLRDRYDVLVVGVSAAAAAAAQLSCASVPLDEAVAAAAARPRPHTQYQRRFAGWSG
jgi:hypothetical protein